MLRYSFHVTYEPYDLEKCEDSLCYEKYTNEIIRQGLCRAFNLSIFNFCSNINDFNYINNVTFFYAHFDIQANNQYARINALNDYLKRLSNITQIVLDKSMKIPVKFKIITLIYISDISE